MIKSKIVPVDSHIAPGDHMHQCLRCYTAWTHGADNLQDEEEHTCPSCGQEQWSKLRTGDDDALIEAIRGLVMSARQRRVLREIADQYAH